MGKQAGSPSPVPDRPAVGSVITTSTTANSNGVGMATHKAGRGVSADASRIRRPVVADVPGQPG